MSGSAVLGGLVVLVAAAGTVSLSQSTSQAVERTAADTVVSVGDQSLGDAPRDSLYARTPPLSRSAERPPLVEPPALKSAAELRVNARSAVLATAAVQAKSYADDLESQAWVLPTTGFYISTWFGEAGWAWSSGYHTGIDFATACGTPEVAVTDGEVVQTGWDGPYGNQVRIQLPNGDQVWYNHLLEIKASLGAQLAKGDLVGLAGETGNAYGCHLHFEYRLAADLETGVDPAPFFALHGINLADLHTSPANRR